MNESTLAAARDAMALLVKLRAERTEPELVHVKMRRSVTLGRLPDSPEASG